ncbi:hypothetical protein SAMN05216466_10778 [Paraburkholderia phenazinium]|uniref:Uncharacterized protein n=1 Tax=Paraburkholderia phenazinium TaxID=60549 RepID=A0A1G7ZLC5_9BURK|nr:hypothetical protein [Paraburkholderia phenazinium]SDH09459.1 hypothetical protein SAMN05216466_10778 [Paraburkholderia phenazinium]
MGIINEASAAPSQLEAALDSGLEQISSNQTVTFQQYTKYTFSEDGYVFWVATGYAIPFAGSLHILSDRQQDEDQTIAANQIVFTAEQEVSQLNSVAPGTLWVGAWQVDDTMLQVAFSSTGMNYQQAGLWHYRGFAVYPALASQLIDSAADLPVGPIVSNSLPIWLAQNSLAPVYPSFLVPDNVVPPYITAHIDPNQTIALQAFPLFDWSGRSNPNADPSPLYEVPSWQLMRDTVKLTFYGFTNQQAIQFFAALMDYSVNTDDFGFCNSPAIVDDKRTQVEIAVLAMKKIMVIQASYYQGTADAIARRLILSAGFSSITVS